MFELAVTILSLVVGVVSTWGIIYFAVRIFIHYRIKHCLGDMPSAKEISEMYKRMNEQNGGDQHPR